MAKKESEFLKRMQGIFDSTWQTIAYDLMEGRRLMAKDFDQPFSDTIPQSEIIVILLDHLHKSVEDKEDKEAFELFDALPYEEKIEVAKICMPDDEYGM